VRSLVVGAFWTAVVLETDPPRCGLASTLRAETAGPWPPVMQAGKLPLDSGRALAELLRSERLLEASIGMAAANALLAGQVPETGTGAGDEIGSGAGSAFREANAEEVILARGTGRQVAIVGHFPFVERVRAAAAQCWVLELKPAPGDLPASEAERVLPQADVVALTSTSLLNHTADELLALCRPEATLLLLGPSTPLAPGLFEAGIDVLRGTVVDDLETVLPSVSQGATFRQIKRNGGVRLVTWMKERTSNNT